MTRGVRVRMIMPQIYEIRKILQKEKEEKRKKVASCKQCLVVNSDIAMFAI